MRSQYFILTSRSWPLASGSISAVLWLYRKILGMGNSSYLQIDKKNIFTQCSNVFFIIELNAAIIAWRTGTICLFRLTSNLNFLRESIKEIKWLHHFKKSMCSLKSWLQKHRWFRYHSNKLNKIGVTYDPIDMFSECPSKNHILSDGYTWYGAPLTSPSRRMKGYLGPSLFLWHPHRLNIYLSWRELQIIDEC